ncbi:hypothetical protein HZB02_07785 [Candidatus Woesearchaeota archaeon]|nr:hypothetical protein [Candidatus Woesearchaeota archaeon]
MAEVKTIKGIDDASWSEFKSLAAQHKKNMGEFFGDLLAAYKAREVRRFWDDILTIEHRLSKEAADEIRKTVATLRKEDGFRETLWH